LDYFEYIRFPFTDKNLLKKILFGSFFLIIPIVNIAALGYLMECLRIGIHNKRRLPDWDDFEFYLRQGISLLIIMSVYIGIPIILSIFLQVIPILGIMLSSVIVLAGILLVPMAAAHAVASNNLLEGFKVLEVFYCIQAVLDYYARACLIMLLIVVLSLIIVFTVPFLSCLGIMVIFYSAIIYVNFIGWLYNWIINKK
jgi:hypothetical protein